MGERSVLFVAAALAACGSDPTKPTGTTPDSGQTDTVESGDSGTPPSAPSASVSVLETQLLAPGTSGVAFGQGIEVRAVFAGETPIPVLEETPGSPLGCKVYEYTPAEVEVGHDEGELQIAMAGSQVPSAIPPCSFGVGEGYTCPHPETAQAGGTIGPGPAAGLFTLTDLDTTFTAGNTTGRHVRVAGATSATNNGQFPIVALAGANTILFANPLAVAEALPAGATHVNVFGAGAIPGVPDPGFLGDDATVEVTLTPSGGGHFAAFTAAFAGDTIGDDFTLDLADANTLNAIALDGAAFTVGCASCGAASASLLDIVTTDGATAGLLPFAMPAPVTTAVHLRCTAAGADSVTVPAELSAYLAGSGATRIRAAFVRATSLTGAPEGATVSAGHAVVGFTDPS